MSPENAEITLWAVGCVFIFPYLLLIVDKICNTHVSCSVMGWHNGKGKATQSFDGCSVHAQCSKCNKDVMQDSQGNWF